MLIDVRKKICICMNAFSTSAILLHRIPGPRLQNRGGSERICGGSDNIKCKNLWVWKSTTCHAKSESCKNLCCMITKKAVHF